MFSMLPRAILNSIETFAKYLANERGYSFHTCRGYNFDLKDLFIHIVVRPGYFMGKLVKIANL